VRYEPEGVPRGRSVVLVLVDPERFDPDDRLRHAPVRLGGRATRAAGSRRSRAAARSGGQHHPRPLRRRRRRHRRLRTDEGFRDFPIEGVVVDFTSGGETFIASIHDLPRFGGGSPDLFVLTVRSPATSRASVREALRAAFPDLLLDVTLNTEYRARSWS
jgi:putative ABC transport system permease protein